MHMHILFMINDTVGFSLLYHAVLSQYGKVWCASAQNTCEKMLKLYHAQLLV